MMQNNIVKDIDVENNSRNFEYDHLKYDSWSLIK